MASKMKSESDKRGDKRKRQVIDLAVCIKYIPLIVDRMTQKSLHARDSINIECEVTCAPSDIWL